MAAGDPQGGGLRRLKRVVAADERYADAVVQARPQGGRGLARGLIYDRNGKLIASTAQEGLIRVVADAKVADAQAATHLPAKA